MMQTEKLDISVLKALNMPIGDAPEMTDWKKFLERLKSATRVVEIALVGKYVELPDAYKSIAEALVHAGASNHVKVKIRWVHSEQVNYQNVAEKLSDVSAILIAPGFGHRGLEGKIIATTFARESKIPFLGICLGMQVAVIEYARNVLGLVNADSREMQHATPFPVIDLMDEQKSITAMGGTMRLGAYPCKITPGSIAAEVYGSLDISERHRHRYEFNNSFLEQFAQGGMAATGINPDTELVEIMEVPEHPWFVGVQFHPEYKSTVVRPHPLFVGFLKAAKKHRVTEN
jgi:CTP synthase